MSLKAVKSASSLSALVRALRSTAKTLPQAVNNITQDALDSLAFQLIYSTPVDTSLALSNWRVGLLIPETDAVTAYDAGEDGSTASQSRVAAYLIAKTVITSKLPSTRVSFVSNNSNHIVELNQGKSPQQPSPYWIETIEKKVEVEAQAKLRALINGN